MGAGRTGMKSGRSNDRGKGTVLPPVWDEIRCSFFLQKARRLLEINLHGILSPSVSIAVIKIPPRRI